MFVVGVLLLMEDTKCGIFKFTVCMHLFQVYDLGYQAGHIFFSSRAKIMSQLKHDRKRVSL